jgi:hypothetical protein
VLHAPRSVRTVALYAIDDDVHCHSADRFRIEVAKNGVAARAITSKDREERWRSLAPGGA